jgi:hypothetical protein
MKLRFYLLLSVCLLLFSSCKKSGIGGDATIKGYVQVKKWNSTFTYFIADYPGKDIYVYIVYGHHPGYDKRIKTDYKGEFEFPYLYKGDYTVYLYSRDSTFKDPSGITTVIDTVNITQRKETVNLDTLFIFQ